MRGRRRRIDAADHAMGMATAQDCRIGLAGKIHIVRVGAGAPHQGRVFAATDRLADAEFGGSSQIRNRKSEIGSLVRFACMISDFRLPISDF